MKKPLVRLSSLVCGALAICALAAPARAQEPTSPPPANLSPPPNSSSSGPVLAGGAIGIGALQWLSSGATDAEFVYDQPVFHVEVGVGYNHNSHPNDTSDSQFRFGVGGWYHLARGSMADFSVGGAIRMIYASANPGGSATDWALEPGAEARIFLSPNFAFSGRVGLVFTFGDNPSSQALGGQTATGFGFTYFFR